MPGSGQRRLELEIKGERRLEFEIEELESSLTEECPRD